MRVKVDFPTQQVNRAIQKLKMYEENRRNLVRKTIAKSAVKIDRDAKDMAPVDTGLLRATIGIERINNGLSARIGSGLLGKEVEYARFIEYGSRAGVRGNAYSNLRHRRGPRKGKSTTFLRPAFDKNKDELLRELRKTITIRE